MPVFRQQLGRSNTVQKTAPLYDVQAMRQQHNIPTPKIQPPQPQKNPGFDWGGLGNQVLNIGKGIVEAPLKIPMKATASLLEPLSGVTNIPFAGNTYQEDMRQQQRALAGASIGQKIESAIGSTLQPALDIGGLALGTGEGSEALAGRQALLNSIKSGAGIGAGYGLVGGMQQGQGLPQLAGSTTLGGVTGGIAGGTLHGLLSSLGRLRGTETPLPEKSGSTENLPPQETLPPPSKNVKTSSYTGIQAPNENNVNPLIQEARKYKSAEEFVKSHDRVIGTNEGETLKNYDKQSQKEWLGGISPKGETIEVYRATPEGKSISRGDYITNDRKYAQLHIDNNLQGEGKITTMRVGLDELLPADAPKEFWYRPKGTPDNLTKQQLTDIWNKSQPLQEGVSQGITPIQETGKPYGLLETIKGSEKTTPEMKSMMNGIRQVAGNKETLASATNRISTDPNGAYQFALNTHSAEGNATAILLAKQMELNGQHQLAADLMMQKAQQALQAGQGNQIYSMWDKLDPETIALTASKQIEKYNQTAVKKIPGLTAEQHQSFVDQAQKIQGMPEGRDKGMATQNLLKSIGQLTPSSTSDKAFALWRAGLLTGLRTPGKIVASHLVSNIAEQAKNIPASIADMALSPFYGGKRGMSLTGRGNVGGFNTGVLNAVDNLVHGYEAPNSGGFQQDFANQTHFDTKTLGGKIAQTYIDTVSRLHGSIYKPFYGAAHLNSLYDMATTEAGNQGLKGLSKENFIQDFVKKATDYSIKNPGQVLTGDIRTPEGAALRANAEAAYTTFQNKTRLGQFASGATRVGGNPARAVAPFTQIPSAIATRIADYSPVGPVKNVIGQILRTGKIDQRSLSQAIGRGAMGTGVMAIGKTLYDNGLMTLGYPTDPKERAQWALEGKKEGAINIDGNWRQMASLGPAGDALLVGGYFADGMKGNKKTIGSTANAALQAGVGGLSVVANSPYMQGIENISQGLTDPTNKALGIGKSYVGSLIPTGLGNVASAIDPLQRKNTSLLDALQTKIPGLRQGLLPQSDVMGQNIPRGNGVLGSMFDPTYPQQQRTSPVTDELSRLDSLGMNSTPSPIGKSLNIQGMSVNLNPQEIYDLNQKSGGALNEILTKVFSNPNYQNLNVEDKQKAIGNIVTKVRDMYKMQELGTKKDALTQAVQKKKLNPFYTTK